MCHKLYLEGHFDKFKVFLREKMHNSSPGHSLIIKKEKKLILDPKIALTHENCYGLDPFSAGEGHGQGILIRISL